MTAKTADWQHVDPLGEPWRGETDDHDAAGTTLGCDYAGRWVLDFIDPGRMQWSHRAFRSRKQAKLWAERNGVTIDAFDDRRLRLDPNHPEHGGPAQDGRDATTPRSGRRAAAKTNHNQKGSDMTAKTKTCNGCGKRKRLDRFGRNAAHRDGLQSDCNDCRKVREAGYRAVKAGATPND